MSIPVYPSLSSYAGSLTDPKEVVPSILRHMFATPSTSSDHYEDYTHNYKISFRRMEADYGHEPAAMCSRLMDELNHVFERYFPDRKINTNVYYKLIDEATNEDVDVTAENSKFVRYTVYIDITETDEDGKTQPIIVSDLVTIDPNSNQFEIKFEGVRHV